MGCVCSVSLIVLSARGLVHIPSKSSASTHSSIRLRLKNSYHCSCRGSIFALLYQPLHED